MHCPRCGQQQVSEDIKFCSRCGFPLGLVSEVLAHGGTLPQLAELQKSGKKWLTRKTGLTFALLWFLFITFLLVPLAAITGAPEEVVASLAVIGFGFALVLTVLSFLMLKSEPKQIKGVNEHRSENQSQYLSGNLNQTTALPPPTSQPVGSYVPPANAWKAPDTGELVPRSVTEGTTKLLQKDE